MTRRRVPMQVPPEFKRKIRKKAGEKDKSMYQLLRDITKDMDEGNEKPKKKTRFEW